MANSTESTSRRSTREDAETFIHALVDDPNNVPDVHYLAGYAGDTGQRDAVRLYLTADLSLYYDIPRSGVRHVERLTGHPGPSGLVGMWVMRDVEVVFGGRGFAERRGRFFSGHCGW